MRSEYLLKYNQKYPEQTWDFFQVLAHYNREQLGLLPELFPPLQFSIAVRLSLSASTSPLSCMFSSLAYSTAELMACRPLAVKLRTRKTAGVN